MMITSVKLIYTFIGVLITFTHFESLRNVSRNDNYDPHFQCESNEHYFALLVTIFEICIVYSSLF